MDMVVMGFYVSYVNSDLILDEILGTKRLSHLQEDDEILATETLRIEHKLFHMNLNRNKRGRRFIKIVEVKIVNKW